MMQIRLTLLQKELPPLQAAFEYKDVPKGGADDLVMVAVGDGAARGSVTIPVEILTMLMGTVMEAAQKRAVPALVGIKPAPLVLG